MTLMKYHALFVIFEKRQNLRLSSDAIIIGGALRVNCLLEVISLLMFCYYSSKCPGLILIV